MNKIVLTLLAGLTLLAMSAVNTYAAGPTVDHKFLLRMPDGGTMELKGAKIHKITDFGEEWDTVVDVTTRYQQGSYCHYPDANNPDFEIGGYKIQRQVSDGFHCSTQQSCHLSDYEAPYLPASFNQNQALYDSYDASFFNFTNQQFTSVLPAYLAELYDPNNIRGFAGARWRGEVNFRAGDGFGIIEQEGFKPFADVAPDNGWGLVDGVSGRQTWGAGEILHNPLGENILQGAVTWYLDVPPEPERPPEIPTAKVSAQCDESSNVYSATISEIDLKGSNFDIADIILNFTYSAAYQPIIDFLGTPHHSKWALEDREPQGGDWFVYTIHRFEADDYSGSDLTFNFSDDTVLFTDKAQDLKTFRELITFVRTQPIDQKLGIQATLRTTDGGFNDYVDVRQINVETGYCEETVELSAAQCIRIQMISDTDTTVISNPSTLKPGDQVRFRCAQAENATSYNFRVAEQGDSGANVMRNLQAGSGQQNNISSVYTIPSAGSFVAQCAVCSNGECQEFAPLPGN